MFTTNHNNSELTANSPAMPQSTSCCSSWTTKSLSIQACCSIVGGPLPGREHLSRACPERSSSGGHAVTEAWLQGCALLLLSHRSLLYCDSHMKKLLWRNVQTVLEEGTVSWQVLWSTFAAPPGCFPPGPRVTRLFDCMTVWQRDKWEKFSQWAMHVCIKDSCSRVRVKAAEPAG